MLLIGHRGAAGVAPENTLAAIRTAIEAGMDMVEVDVRMTADHHLVLMHDATVDRMTDGHGLVAEKTLAELRKLDAGNGERVPSLQEALDAVKGKCMIAVELKEHGMEVAVAEMIEQNKLGEQCVVTSFFHPLLRMLRAYAQNRNAAAVFIGEPVDPAGMAQQAGASILWTNAEFITAEMVSKVHNAGLKMFVGRVDDEETAKRMMRLGVDGISSDYPNMLRKAVKAHA